MACCGKKPKSQNTYYSNKFGVDTMKVDSPNTVATKSINSVKKSLECNTTYKDLLTLFADINKSDKDTDLKSLMRMEIANMINDINKKCPDEEKIKSIRENLYGSESL